MTLELDRSQPGADPGTDGRTSRVDPQVEHEIDQVVAVVVDRVAARLIEAIEHDDGSRTDRHTPGAPLAADERRQQLLVGAWIGEEVTTVNEERLQRGARPLSQLVEQRIRARVVAELTGAGPLEAYLG